MDNVGSTGQPKPHLPASDQKAGTQPPAQEAEGKISGRAIKPANSSPVEKKVRFDEAFLSEHGEGKKATKRTTQEREIHTHENPASTINPSTEESRQQIMLDCLHKGSQADFEAFTQEFKLSRCSYDIASFKALIHAVSEKKDELSKDAKTFFLKTCMEHTVEKELTMLTHVDNQALMGKTSEWLRDLELERTKALSIEGFSQKEIATAMQARAEEIAANLNVPLPENWQSLPDVSHEVSGMSTDTKKVTAMRLTKALLPDVEEQISVDLIKRLKPDFDAWVQENLPEEKDNIQLNTLSDIVLNVDDGITMIVDAAKEYIAALPAANFKKTGSHRVQQIMEQLLKEKYTTPEEDSDKPATE